MTEQTTRDWLVPGAKAVVLQPYDSAALRATPVTIDRVLKRDVVLSNGERFRIDTLERRLGGTYGHSEYLVNLSDPRIAETRIKIKGRNLRARAIATFENWRRGRDTAADVADAFAALAAFEITGRTETPDTTVQEGSR